MLLLWMYGPSATITDVENGSPNRWPRALVTVMFGDAGMAVLIRSTMAALVPPSRKARSPTTGVWWMESIVTGVQPLPIVVDRKAPDERAERLDSTSA